jgi:glycine oxidase
MKRTTDIVIIGGGVIGCAIAYYLRKAGKDALVLERGEIGAEASSAAAGLLAPLGPLAGPGPFADALLHSFRLFSALIPQLEEESGISLGYEQTGALRTVRNPKRVAHLEKRMKAWQSLGLQLSWLSGDEARQREPLLASDVCAAVHAPEEAQIRAPQVVSAFAKAARKMGAQIVTHTEVVDLRKEKDRITGVQTSQGEIIMCNHVIITTGAWAAQWGSRLDMMLPVSPLRGQILSLEQATPPLRHIIFGDAIYITPKGESIFVGATKEEAGFDVHVTEEGTSWLHKTAIGLLPTLQQSRRVNTWAGLRPKTPDTRPILGSVPHWKNVTLAVGHNSVGVLLSPLTGRSITELLLTGKAPPLIRPFSVERLRS